MNTLDTIKQRTSCRTFLDEPLSREVIEKLVDAGRHAPTARNVQPVEYVVVTDAGVREKIAMTTDYGRFIKNAPVCIVVIAKDTKYYLEDGCAAVENILLAASAQRLGACWVAGDKKAYAADVLAVLNVPTGFKLVALVPVGRPNKELVPREKNSLQHILHWEKY